MKYYIENGIHTIKCLPKEFSIVLVNEKKKNVKKATYTNLNFFGNYSEQGEPFTLPAGHLIAKFESNSKWEKHYCQERGKFIGDKFIFDAGKFSYDKQFYNKNLTTFYIENGVAKIGEMKTLNQNYEFAASGVPIMRNGRTATFYGDVVSQGFNGSVLYATKHIFIGLKPNDPHIYIMGYKSTTSNLVLTDEVYKKMKALGYSDVVKFDGGGSYHFEVNNKVVDTMSENRRISAIVCVENLEVENDQNAPSDWAKSAWDKAVKKSIFTNNPKAVVTEQEVANIFEKLNKL